MVAYRLRGGAVRRTAFAANWQRRLIPRRRVQEVIPRRPDPMTPEQCFALRLGTYEAIDSLWFMAVEQRFGNAAAR